MLSPEAKGLTCSKDHWIGIKERNQRKKLQNRLNQRRLRQRRKKDEVQVLLGKPYRISRWRIEQTVTPQLPLRSPKITASHSSSPESLNSSTNVGTQSSHSDQEAENPLALAESMYFSPKPNFPINSASAEFPMSSDHLIRLIHLNVFSALMKNKSLLDEKTYLTRHNAQGPSLLVIPPSRDFCNGLTVVHPIVDGTLPMSLEPTTLQKTIPHASWLNIFPFPTLRDNLIVHESMVDSIELLYDLFGDIVGGNDPSPDPNDYASIPAGEEDDIYNEKRGLIVWGEPWDKQGWEITPGFMRKWSWLLKGCEELIAVSNHWRAMRGEAPLHFEEIVE